MKINSLIETERCFLKEITIDDSEQIVKWRSDPNVYCFFKNPIKISLESHLKWFNDSYLINENRIDLILYLKNTNIKIGVFSICKCEDNKAEVSYLLDERLQGKGFASEALNAMEQYFASLWGINSFIAEIHKDNIKSITFIKKMGYVKSIESEHFYIFEKQI